MSQNSLWTAEFYSVQLNYLKAVLLTQEQTITAMTNPRLTPQRLTQV